MLDTGESSDTDLQCQEDDALLLDIGGDNVTDTNFLLEDTGSYARCRETLLE
jgi:hypothetical protein